MESITDDEIVEAIMPIGWERPDDVDGCSSNCRLNVLNNFVHTKRFGYNPYELELSHLVRKGLLTRDEALGKIDDQPEHYLKSLMNDLDMDV